MELISENDSLGQVGLISNFGDTSMLLPIIKPKFILRITEENCSVCLDSIITRIEKRPGIIENMMIITSEDKQRNLKAYRNSLTDFLEFNRTINPNGFTNLDIEKYQIPYCFILKPPGIVSHIYIPDKLALDFFEEYLSLIEYKFY